jgi:hypothetical protein
MLPNREAESNAGGFLWPPAVDPAKRALPTRMSPVHPSERLLVETYSALGTSYRLHHT